MQKTGKISIIPTPLGNLGDMTARALEALRGADVVFAEDTRVTGKLLSVFDIHARLERMDENLMASGCQGVIDRVLAGETVAYCSDAGMPGVSDPGMRLVAAAHEAQVPVEVLPGGTAVATAYVASGFTNPHFYFGGFLPRKAQETRTTLEALRALDAVLIFYESPNRVADSLGVIAQVFPQRRVAVCRELTKLHEEVFVDASCAVAAEFAQRAATEAGIKGEIVVCIESAPLVEQAAAAQDSEEAARQQAGALLAQGMRVKEAAALLAERFGIPKNVAYDIALGAK